MEGFGSPASPKSPLPSAHTSHGLFRGGAGPLPAFSASFHCLGAWLPDGILFMALVPIHPLGSDPSGERAEMRLDCSPALWSHPGGGRAVRVSLPWAE